MNPSSQSSYARGDNQVTHLGGELGVEAFQPVLIVRVELVLDLVRVRVSGEDIR